MHLTTKQSACIQFNQKLFKELHVLITKSFLFEFRCSLSLLCGSNYKHCEKLQLQALCKKMQLQALCKKMQLQALCENIRLVLAQTVLFFYLCLVFDSDWV